MNSWSELDRLLQTDPRDSGCQAAMAVLHVYAELVDRDAEEARRRFPGVSAHLQACGPCADDLEGLLAAIRPVD